MFLEKILAVKKEEIAEAKTRESLDKLKEKVTALPSTRNFTEALEKGGGINLIAEVKKASPSKGIIREDFQPVEIAKIYETSGANALSILTDSQFFQGSLDYLSEIKRSVSLPLLRKDFIVDEYQIYQSRAYGADAILLIAAALKKEQLIEFLSLAKDLKLACLVEVHDQKELEIVLDCSAWIIGINNRNLHTFQTDIATTLKLISQLPKGKIVVSESGINFREDVEILERKGVDAILVGEALMRSQDIGSKVRELMGA